MTTAIEHPMITEKQVTYIKDLADKRDWIGANLPIEFRRVITNILIDNLNIPRKLASQTIDALQAVKPWTKPTSDFTELQDILKSLPLSRYALPRVDGTGWDFFEISEWKQTKTRFIQRLLGNPGDWNRAKLSPKLAYAAAKHIAEAPKDAAVQYAKQHGRCAVCNAFLSDPDSIAQGLGPVCAKRF
jgi:hypothetical protein